MPTYLLDSNILSDIVRNPQGASSRTFGRRAFEPDAELITSIIVACEMRFGVAKKGSTSLAQRVERVLASVAVMPLASGADAAYATLRADLESRGQPIGQNDMLIAAHALALGAILVTDNTREFKRIKGLRVENWLRP